MAVARTGHDRKGQSAAIIQNRHDNGMIGKHLHITSHHFVLVQCLDASARAEISGGAREKRDINRTGLHIADARGMIDCVALLLFDDSSNGLSAGKERATICDMVVISLFYCELRDDPGFFAGPR